MGDVWFYHIFGLCRCHTALGPGTLGSAGGSLAEYWGGLGRLAESGAAIIQTVPYFAFLVDFLVVEVEAFLAPPVLVEGRASLSLESGRHSSSSPPEL